MQKIYTSFRCIGCNKTMIFLTSEKDSTLKQGKYLSCSHCGCKKLRVLNTNDNLKECMNHSSYKRERGAIRQVRNE